MVTASVTHGYSLCSTWLQPLFHMVTASFPYGYSTPRSMRTGRQWRPVKVWDKVNKRDGEVDQSKLGGALG